MASRTFLLLLFAFISVRGDEGFIKCAENDAQCLKTQAQTYLSQLYGGDSKLGIEPIDPLAVASIDFDFAKDLGWVFHLKNINITGFRNSQVTDLKWNSDKTIETMKIQVDLSIVSDIGVEIRELQRTYEGSYNVKATFVGTSEYRISFKNVNGKEYYVVGPETTNCEILGDPNVTIGSELKTALDKDPDTAKHTPVWLKNKDTIRKKILCGIANSGFAAVINSFRNLGNAYDKSTFIADV